MEMAYFDLDETIVATDSTTLWLDWLVKHNLASDELLQEDERLLALYYQGNVDITEYIELSLLPIKGMGISEVDILVSQFLQDEVAPKLYPDALERLAWHKNRGDHIILISASSAHLVKPIGHYLGVTISFGVEPHTYFDEYTNESIYSGKIVGEPTFKAGKVKKIQAYLAEKNQRDLSNLKSYAYSDSINDRYLLEFATTSYVINPNEVLRDLAIKKGWTSLYWR